MKRITKIITMMCLGMLVFTACEKKLPVIEKNDVVENIAPTTNKSISKAILLKNEGKYVEGEFEAEAHKTIEIEVVTDQYQPEEGKKLIKAYSLVTYGKYQIIDDEYVRVAGSEVFPVAMTFSKSEEGVIDLLNYQVPNEKKKYEKEIKKIFPERIWDDLLNIDELVKEDLLKKELECFD